MSMKKILFSGPEGSANIDGLIEALRRTSPAPMAALDDGGGRIQGEATADDSPKRATYAGDGRIQQQQKC